MGKDVRVSHESLGPLLALGHTAEVYQWLDGRIVKLFRDGFPLTGIEHEARVTRLVCQAGLPVPVVGEMIEIHGRYGLIYERVNGRPMLQTLASRPWTLAQYARLLADLQAQLHRIAAIPGLPSQHQKLREQIQAANRLPLELRQAVLNMLKDLPEGNQLCHGDFHPDNVLITNKGPVIIDWIGATSGNPLADVARSSLLLTKAPIPAHHTIRWLLDVGRQQFHRIYLRHYFELCPGDQDLVRWRIVNAAARLSEGTPETQVLLAFVQTELKQSL